MITQALKTTFDQNLWILKAALEDFTEGEMFVRPCEGANHAMWQIGHLITSEASMINAIQPGTIKEIPAGFAEKFGKDRASVDDPKMFPAKAELIQVVEAVRSATWKWVSSLTETDFEKPGPEKMREFLPTVGHTVLLIPNHLAMHLGQIQVIRRKLGKPHIM